MFISINTAIVNKPVSAKHGIFSGPFNPYDLTPDQLIEKITLGYAFSAQFVGEKRKKVNFIKAGFLAVDIDEGMTLQEARDHLFVKSFASFIYTTPSHTPEANRFRIVFELESPIDDASQYQSALSGLIKLLGGDTSCKDAARLFYGNTTAEVHRLNKTIADAEVQALVSSVTAHNTESGVIKTNQLILARTKAPFSSDYVVKHHTGRNMMLREVPKNDRGIHCPFHNDTRPSALVVESQTGGIGIYCSSCSKTAWTTDSPSLSTTTANPFAFDWHVEYQQQAQNYMNMWPLYGHDEHPVIGAPDGTNIWFYEESYLPQLPIRPGVTFIRSPKGSGKTERLADLVKELKSQGKSILLIGHRQLLIRNLATRLDLTCYLSEDSHADAAATRCLAVSLDSLQHRVAPLSDKFDVVIIDESEQVLSHFAGKTLANKRIGTLALLSHLLREAEFVFCADADIGMFTAGFFYIDNGLTHPHHLVINAPARPTALSAGATTVVEMYEDDSGLLDAVHADLAAGKRCFITCNSRETARSIHATLTDRFPAKKNLLITANTKMLKTVGAFIEDPAASSLNYDAVVCSPALSTGVDISFPNNKIVFDSVYGFFRDRITTHFEMDQQLSRVRATTTVRVWVSPRQISYETDPLVVLAELKQNRDLAERVYDYLPDGTAKYLDDKILDLVAWIISLRRISLSNLRESFIALKKSNGWSVKQVATGPSTRRLDQDVCDQEMTDLICAAKDISPTEYKMLMARAKGRIRVEKEDIACLRRYAIKAAYPFGIPVTPELIALDDSGTFVPKLNNLRLLVGYADKNYFMDTEKRLRAQELEEVGKRDVSSIDWNLRLQRRILLNDLLTSAELFESEIAFRFDTVVSKSTLGPFIDLVTQRSLEIRSLLDIEVRRDLRSKPVIQLREVLKTIGMKIGPMARSRPNGVRNDGYMLDSEHWRFVASTCGIDTSLVDRHALQEQLIFETTTQEWRDTAIPQSVQHCN